MTGPIQPIRLISFVAANPSKIGILISTSVRWKANGVTITASTASWPFVASFRKPRSISMIVRLRDYPLPRRDDSVEPCRTTSRRRLRKLKVVEWDFRLIHAQVLPGDAEPRDRAKGGAVGVRIWLISDNASQAFYEGFAGRKPQTGPGVPLSHRRSVLHERREEGVQYRCRHSDTCISALCQQRVRSDTFIH